MRCLLTLSAMLIPFAACPGEPRAVTGSFHEIDASGDTPAVSISRTDLGVRIKFKGTLQSALTPHGLWSDVPNASTPFDAPMDQPVMFFRARGPESIFSSHQVINLTMTGPLQTNFDLAFAGTPDGIFPPQRERPYFEATVQLGSLAVPVSLRVRGNSSLQECPFPKVKFKVSRDDRVGTPFFDAREIKVGTHCAEGGHGPIGRLRDERAAFREALAYEAMELMGFTAPRVRRARIEYRDTSPANTTSSAGWRLSRFALLLDDIEVVAERCGGRALDDSEIAALTNPDFDEQLVTDLRLFHALLGNWDYGVTTDGRGLWNTDVIELPDGKLRPVAGDFDLSSWVTEVARLSAPRDYHPELGEVERQARYELEQIQQRVSGLSFAAGIDHFQRQWPALESLLAAAELDEAGRANAQRHVKAFFDAVNAVTVAK